MEEMSLAVPTHVKLKRFMTLKFFLINRISNVTTAVVFPMTLKYAMPDTFNQATSRIQLGGTNRERVLNRCCAHLNQSKGD